MQGVGTPRHLISYILNLAVAATIFLMPLTIQSVAAPAEAGDPILYESYQEMMLLEYGIVSPARLATINYDSVILEVPLDLDVGELDSLGKWDYAKGYWSCQCVAYARTSISFPTVLRASNIWKWSDSIGLTRTDDPQEGDLIVTNEGLYGHVGIVERVSDGAVQIVEQNYLPCLKTRRVLAIDDARILGFVTK